MLSSAIACAAQALCSSLSSRCSTYRYHISCTLHMPSTVMGTQAWIWEPNSHCIEDDFPLKDVTNETLEAVRKDPSHCHRGSCLDSRMLPCSLDH